PRNPTSRRDEPDSPSIIREGALARVPPSLDPAFRTIRHATTNHHPDIPGRRHSSAALHGPGAVRTGRAAPPHGSLGTLCPVFRRLYRAAGLRFHHGAGGRLLLPYGRPRV